MLVETKEGDTYKQYSEKMREIGTGRSETYLL